jgi:glycosyltransferase involved in cell wall biosynthesis
VPSISVVIPVRNDAAMLTTALEALAAQTRPPDEIVVVDNGSSDASAMIADRAGARVVPEPRRGIPYASSTGYDNARGAIIARIDADSVCPPGWLAQIERAFENDPGLDLLTGTGDFYGGTEIAHRLGRAWYIDGYFWSMTPYLGHPPAFGSNFAMRRDVWLEVGSEVHRETGIHDDLDLSLHLKPWMNVEYDPTLVVGISARPFDTWAALRRRLSWVIPTLRYHWPEDAPWRRRAARRRWLEENEAQARA